MKNLKNLDLGLLLLRFFFGGAMLYGHGWGKLMRLTGSAEIKFSDPFGVGSVASLTMATFAEFLCALLVMLGIFTRWTTIPLIFTMLVAIFYAHAGDPFKDFEKALLFLGAFTALMIMGGGAYSLDRFFQKKTA